MMTKNRDTILIVDDMELNRMILHGIFEKDYTIVEAENGRQALSIVSQHHDTIAAILLDIVMPEMDGYEVMKKLNDGNYLSEFPIIIITAENSAEIELQAFDCGASEIIVKPFEAHVVKRRVQNSIDLNRRKLHQDEIIQEQANKIRNSSTLIIDALSEIIEGRSIEAGNHVKRIRLFTKVLLQDAQKRLPELSLDDNLVELISNASSMHDIGKISIPDQILNKPGKLSPEEFAVMKTHTTEGCKMLDKLKRIGSEDLLGNKLMISYAYNICRYHHERWDGKGYPDGLAGDNIPICAQIVGIADCYDALTNDRCYRKALPVDKAIDMILNGECGTFSPKLLTCLEDVKPEFSALTAKYKDSADKTD
jgi:response regulator RpfG family c-di-GMP phosphodiesterase